MITALGLVALILAALPAVLAVVNLCTLAATPRRSPAPDALVSILIPARNEEDKIGAAVAAALSSTGVAVEVLVMDDGSGDRTAAVVKAAMADEPRLHLLSAPPLAPGWTGKIHACHHLAEAARGTHLLFVDADVQLAPGAAAALCGHARATGAGLVSAVPRQVMRSLGELLTVPTINLMLLGYLPMRLMRRSLDPRFGAACGQVLLVDRASYCACGGHAAIRHLLHDGLQLARLFRRKGHATDLLFGHDLASCRMYRRFGEAWAGFAKNAHEGIATKAALPVWTALLLGGHVLPFALLPFWPSAPVALAALLSLLARASVTLTTRENLLAIPLHPFTVLTGIAIQWSSLLRIGKGRRAGWKGRLYPVG